MNELTKALMLVGRLRKHRDFSYLTLRRIIASEDHDEARVVASRAAQYLESEWVEVGKLDKPPQSPFDASASSAPPDPEDMKDTNDE